MSHHIDIRHTVFCLECQGDAHDTTSIHLRINHVLKRCFILRRRPLHFTRLCSWMKALMKFMDDICVYMNLIFVHFLHQEIKLLRAENLSTHFGLKYLSTRTWSRHYTSLSPPRNCCVGLQFVDNKVYSTSIKPPISTIGIQQDRPQIMLITSIFTPRFHHSARDHVFLKRHNQRAGSGQFGAVYGPKPAQIPEDFYRLPRCST